MATKGGNKSTRPRYCASEEDIFKIAKILNKPESPTHEAIQLTFVTNIRNSQELFAQVAIPLEDTEVESLGLKDYELKDVMLGKPTWDTA